jgi:hypothetical protein
MDRRAERAIEAERAAHPGKTGKIDESSYALANGEAARQWGDLNELLMLNVVPFAAQEAKPPVILHAFNPADWEGKTAPPRLWIVLDYIPAGTVTLLYADGGTGKSYLKLQLAVARALSKEWIGAYARTWPHPRLVHRRRP